MLVCPSFAAASIMLNRHSLGTFTRMSFIASPFFLTSAMAGVYIVDMGDVKGKSMGKRKIAASRGLAQKEKARRSGPLERGRP